MCAQRRRPGDLVPEPLQHPVFIEHSLCALCFQGPLLEHSLELLQFHPVFQVELSQVADLGFKPWDSRAVPLTDPACLLESSGAAELMGCGHPGQRQRDRVHTAS